jgi:acyl-CoA synthetase (AMP-forming)/AMP-acid ligase II
MRSSPASTSPAGATRCAAPKPVSPQTLDEFARRFARWGFRREALTPVYGLAEAGLAVTFGALDAPFTVGRFERRALLAGRAVADRDGREIAGVGMPLPGFSVAARDDAGRDLPPAASARSGCADRR